METLRADVPDEGFSPRYLAYCEAHGRAPEAMLAHDRERWPGGRMAGFILWVGRRWSAWCAAKGIPERPPTARSAEDHAAFDRYLAALPRAQEAS